MSTSQLIAKILSHYNIHTDDFHRDNMAIIIDAHVVDQSWNNTTLEIFKFLDMKFTPEESIQNIKNITEWAEETLKPESEPTPETPEASVPTGGVVGTS